MQQTSSIRVIFVPYASGNPYQDELAKGLEAENIDVVKGQNLASLFKCLLIPQQLPDIVHLHWLPMVGLDPLNFIRSLLFIFRLFIFRLRGVKLVWTAHNLIPHESKHPMADTIFRRVVGKAVHRVIAHGDTAREELVSKLGVSSAKIAVVPHGSYIGVYETRISGLEAKKQLGIDESKLVMLFLGSIRPYKGTLDLIREFKAAGFNETDVCLIIAGRPLNAELSEMVISEIGDTANIDYRPGFVPHDMVGVYMSAADVVVMPYKKVLSSGAALLAMSLAKSCLAPAIGCLKDVLSSEGAFLYSNNDPAGLRQALVAAFHNRRQLQKMGAVNLERAKSWSWLSVGKQTAEVYACC